MTGTMLAQAVSLVTAPILYRIYDKEDYGTLGLYMAITGVIGVFSNMQYLQAILLEKEEENAKRVLWLNRVINLGVAVMAAVIILIFNQPLANLLNNPSIAAWLYLAPISIFFSGQNHIFRVWANRKKKYRILSFNAILTAVLVPTVSISLGVLYDGWVLGLFMGLLTSHVFPPIVLFIALNRSENLGRAYFDRGEMRKMARKYSDFPKYSLPANFFNRFTNQLPVFMLSSFVGPGAVGVYNLTIRMLGLPIQLIASAIGTVFRERAAKDFNTIGNCREIFKKTLKTLSSVSVVPFSILALFGPAIFAFIFGEPWRDAGVFARILSIMFFFKLIVPPLAFTFILKNKQREDFVWHFYTLISTMAIFYLGFTVFQLQVEWVLLIFALNFALFYVMYFLRAFTFSKG